MHGYSTYPVQYTGNLVSLLFVYYALAGWLASSPHLICHISVGTLHRVVVERGLCKGTQRHITYHHAQPISITA